MTNDESTRARLLANVEETIELEEEILPDNRWLSDYFLAARMIKEQLFEPSIVKFPTSRPDGGRAA